MIAAWIAALLINLYPVQPVKTSWPVGPGVTSVHCKHPGFRHPTCYIVGYKHPGIRSGYPQPVKYSG